MLKRYPDAEATMGEGKKVGETGPDDAGKNLELTTVKVRSFAHIITTYIMIYCLVLLFIFCFAIDRLHMYCNIVLNTYFCLLNIGIYHKAHVQSIEILF